MRWIERYMARRRFERKLREWLAANSAASRGWMAEGGQWRAPASTRHGREDFFVNAITGGDIRLVGTVIGEAALAELVSIFIEAAPLWEAEEKEKSSGEPDDFIYAMY